MNQKTLIFDLTTSSNECPRNSLVILFCCHEIVAQKIILTSSLSKHATGTFHADLVKVTVLEPIGHS